MAKILSGKYRSPEALEKVLIDESRRPVKERAFANYYANPGGARMGERIRSDSTRDISARMKAAR